MVMDTATNVGKATDGYRGLEDDQREPVTRDERMVMKTRAAQRVEDRGKKTRFTMDIVTDPCSTGKCCLFYIKLVNNLADLKLPVRRSTCNIAENPAPVGDKLILKLIRKKGRKW